MLSRAIAGLTNVVLSQAPIYALGNHGLWAAVWIYMALRAATLALSYPRLEARAGA